MHLITTTTSIPYATIYISTVILSYNAYVYMPYRPEAPLWYYIYLKYIYIYIYIYIFFQRWGGYDMASILV